MQKVNKNWSHDGSLEKIGPSVQRFDIKKTNLLTYGNHAIKMQLDIKQEYDLKSIDKIVMKIIIKYIIMYIINTIIDDAFILLTKSKNEREKKDPKTGHIIGKIKYKSAHEIYKWIL